MAKGASTKCFFLFFIQFGLFLNDSVNSSDIPHAKDSHDFEQRELQRQKEELFPRIRRELIEYFRYKMTEFDSIDPPTTTFPTSPITNPNNSSPGIITVPGTNPNPTPTNPVNPPVPVTNPVNPPVPVTNPPVPVTNPPVPVINPPVPVTNPPVPVINPPVPVINPPVPVTNPPVPVTNPPVPVTNPPVPFTNPPVPVTNPGGSGGGGGGQRWCIAKNGAAQAALQAGLDYACGIGGADCSTIQQGASCYNPITLQNHASYAFNSYYQKNPVPTSCDFGGVAVVTTVNPSTGSCVYPSSSTSSTSSSPTTQAPVNPTSLPTPTTSSSSGSIVPGTQSPPPGFSFGNPDTSTGVAGGFGATPPIMNTPSLSNNLRPFVGFFVIVPSITMGRLMFGM